MAGEITRVHHNVTGAPAYFARLAFDEAEPGAVLVGGAPLRHDHVFLLGLGGGCEAGESRLRSRPAV